MSPYSQEYLSLLARKGKLFAKKIGRNWFTTEEAVRDYLSTQSVVVSLPKVVLNDTKTFENLFDRRPKEIIEAKIDEVTTSQKSVLEKIDSISESLKNFSKPEPKRTRRSGGRKILFGMLLIFYFSALFGLGAMYSGKVEFSDLKPDNAYADILEPVRDFIRKYLLPEYTYQTYLVVDPQERYALTIKEQELRIIELEKKLSAASPQMQPAPTEIKIIKEVTVGPSGIVLTQLSQRIDNVASLIEATRINLSNLSNDFTSFQRITPTAFQLPPTNTSGIGPITLNPDKLEAGTITATGGSTFNSTLSVLNDFTVDTNVLKVDTTNNRVGINTSSPETAFEVVGTASISGNLTLGGTLTALGNIGIGTTSAPNQLTVIGSGSFTGQLKATRNPTQPHTGTWPSFTNTNDSTLYINPSSPVADGNVIAYVSGSDPKFVVDAEGDIYGNNLILTGSTTTGTTTIAGDLNVEGNMRFGDASGDKIKFVGTILPQTLSTIPLSVKASASQTADLFRINDHNDNRLLTVDFPSGLLISSSGFNFALGTSTATTSYSRLGTATTTHSNYVSKYNDLLVSGDLEVDASAQFDSFLQVGTNTLYANPTTGNVGIGTTNPVEVLAVIGNIAVPQGNYIRLRGTDGGGNTIFIQHDNTQFRLSTNASAGDGFLFRDSDNKNIMVIKTSVDGGNVGIATNAPGALLHVSGETFPHTGPLFIVASGSNERFRVTSAGNIGIGTTTPDSLLELSSTATNFIIRSTGSTSSASIDFQPAGGASSSNQGKFTIRAGGLGGTSERLDIINADSTKLFTIASSGNVGIGTTIPGVLFEVSGTSSSILARVNNSDATAYDSANMLSGGRTFRVGNTNASAAWVGQEFFTRNSSFSSIGAVDTGSATSHLVFGTGNPVTERMRIEAGGNVGIGTTTANAKFNVSGNIRLVGAGGSFAELYAISPSGEANLALKSDGGVFIDLDEDNDSGGAESFGIRKDAAATTLFTVFESGNVGIGTTTVGSQLHLYQSTTDTTEPGIKVEQAGTGDASINFNLTGAINWSVGADNSDSDTFKISAATDLATSNALTITTGGNVGIGTTGPVAKLDVVGTAGANDIFRVASSSGTTVFKIIKGGNIGIGVGGVAAVTESDTGMTFKTAAINNLRAMRIWHTEESNNQVMINFNRKADESEVGSIQATTTNTSYVTSSDRRLKENIELTALGLDTLMNIQVRDFNFISEPSTRVQGLIAQELHEAYPYAVIVGGEDPKRSPWSVDYGRITPLIVRAVQEQQTQIASLSFRIEELEKKMNDSEEIGITGGTVISIASGSPSITTTSESGLTMPDVLAELANAAVVQVKNLWAKGDIIAEGIKKTYYSVAEVFDWEFSMEVMAASWNSREITFAPNVDAETSAVFSGSGAQAANQSKVDLAENGVYLATYGVDSTRGEIQLSGSSEINGGEAKIFFDFSFTSVISDNIPLKVIITPTTAIQGQLYVANKTQYGFVVKSQNGPGDAKFDWLAIARRKGYEGDDGTKTGELIVSEPITETASLSEPIISSPEETTASSSAETLTEPVVEQTASSSEEILVEPLTSPETTATASASGD